PSRQKQNFKDALSGARLFLWGQGRGWAGARMSDPERVSAPYLSLSLRAQACFRGRMEVVFLGTGTSQGVPMIACDCAVCTSPDPRNKRTRASVHVEMDGLHVQIDASPEFRLQCVASNIRWVDFFILT